MKIISIAPKDNGKQFDKKETITSRELIGFADGKFFNLATARWYMDKSSNASTIYCSIWINSNALHNHTHWTSCAGHGSAGGGGYCKKSAAFADALQSAGVETDTAIDGLGMSVVDEFLTELATQAGFHSNYISRGKS